MSFDKCGHTLIRIKTKYFDHSQKYPHVSFHSLSYFSTIAVLISITIASFAILEFHISEIIQYKPLYSQLTFC